jgi:predicted metal-binding protein
MSVFIAVVFSLLAHSLCYVCPTNCSTVFNRFCRTQREVVCPYPDGDDMARTAVRKVTVKSQSQACQVAMRRFVCATMFPRCRFADVDMICHSTCMSAYGACGFGRGEASFRCRVFANAGVVAVEGDEQCFSAAPTLAPAALLLLLAILLLAALL